MSQRVLLKHKRFWEINILECLPLVAGPARRQRRNRDQRPPFTLAAAQASGNLENLRNLTCACGSRTGKRNGGKTAAGAGRPPRVQRPGLRRSCPP